MTTASCSVIEPCNYVFQSACHDRVSSCGMKNGGYGPHMFMRSVCIKLKDDLIFKLVSDSCLVSRKTLYLFKESSVEVKPVIHGDSTITFSQPPFIKHVPSHEP